MDFDDLDAQPGCRLYDIVVYGATGITGALVAEHLDELIAAGKTDKKWAIAGRNEEKLKKLAKNCKTNPGVIKAETQEDLDWVAEVSSVIIATAGPYLLIGQAVVEACVKHSTHYIDVTGEIVYNRRCIDKYHDEAKEKGIMIVIMVGFMCALSDYNLYTLQQELGPLKRFHEYIMCTAAVRGGGSFLSGWSQFEHMRTDEPPLLIDPYSLGGHRKCGTRVIDKDAVEAYKSEHFPNVWCSTGFAGHPGVRVCRRSCELFENSVDAIDFGEEIVISSCDCTFSHGQAKLNAQMAKPPEDIKKIMSNAQAMEDGLMKGAGGRPGYGAPRETRLLSASHCWAIAESVDGKWASARFDGPEGYEFTAQAAVNGAIVFVEEQDKVRASERGGVVTPSFAFHGTTWRERLAEQSWAMGPGVVSTWTVKEGKLTEAEFEATLKEVDAHSKDFSKKMMTGEYASCELPELVTGRHLKK